MRPKAYLLLSLLAVAMSSHLRQAPSNKDPLPRGTSLAALGTDLATDKNIGPLGPESFKQRAFKVYSQVPLRFEINHGQTKPSFDFLSRGADYALFLSPSEAVLSLPGSHRKASRKMNNNGRLQEPVKGNSTTLRMRVVGANPAARLSGLEPLPGKSNYFIGNNPRNWRTNIPAYGKVIDHDVYPGVDLVYYGNQGQIEFDFVIAPGADPRTITLDLKGAFKLKVDAQGNLVVQTGSREIHLQKPRIYQQVDLSRRTIAGKYVFRGRERIGFEVAEYDVNRPLIVDPTLGFSTYLGGSDLDVSLGTALDSSNNIYITGYTVSGNFPTVNPFQPVKGRSRDVFVSKLNAAGTALEYSTFIGGSAQDEGHGIAVDASGNAYVAGSTLSSDFPTTPGALRTTPGADANDAFILKLGPTGSTLVYSTYLAGSMPDEAGSIAVDSAGNAFVTGQTESSDLPTTPGAFQTSAPGNTDAYVAKINDSGSALIYCTYLGGSFTDVGEGIAIDSAGNAYVTGSTQSTTFPTTTGAFRTTPAGGSDAFVAKLNTTGSALAYSTYLGGSSIDKARTIAVDASGNAYVTGFTTSTDFPTVGPIQGTLAGGSDAFVTKLKADGSGLVYSTFLGGSDADRGRGIAVDSSGNTYVSGFTSSVDFPTANPFQPTLGGGRDAFVAKIDPAGSVLVYSSYLGGAQAEDNFDGAFVAADSSGNAYVTGDTASTNFPVVNALQATCASCTTGLTDAFVAKVVLVPFPVVNTSPGSLTFPSQGVGTTSTAQMITLRNSGDVALTINSVQSSGDFAQTNNCPVSPSTVAPGASCNINVTFNPTTTGNRSGQVTITDDAAGSPHLVPLSGTGITGPFLALSATSLAFANQPVGTTSAQQTVTLSNPGNATLTFNSIVASGDFAQTNTCGTSVSTTASCTISITFSPAVSGARNGVVTITDNAPGSPQTIALSGTGIDADFSIATSPTTATITAGQTATYTATVAPILGFNQPVSLSCAGAPTAATCSISPSSLNLDGTNSVTATLIVTTTARSMTSPLPRGIRPGTGSPIVMPWILCLLALILLARLDMVRRSELGARVRVATALLFVVLAAGCGGGSSSTPPPPPPTGTPAGTYTLTLNATSGSISHMNTITLKVN